MGINKVQFQKGLSMVQFMERYGTEEKCHAVVVALRWPDGLLQQFDSGKFRAVADPRRSDKASLVARYYYCYALD